MGQAGRMTVDLCVLLWAHDGQEAALVAYEDEVLALVPAHGGSVLQRVRARHEGVETAQPFEVHVIRFPDQAAFDGYLADPRRAELADRRDAAIARTEVQRVQVV
jgi:uncharacterized protein (DUF1330 family)